jgi:hypothetical protein
MVAAITAASAQAAPQVQGEQARSADRDVRVGHVAPTAHQRALAARAGVRATWTRFGTPRSLTKARGPIATGLSRDAVRAARQWIADNRALLGIDRSHLKLVRSARIGAGRAVMLRQRFGSLPIGRDGLIVVGVAGGKVSYVSSSLAADRTITNTQRLSARDAVRAAAANSGIAASALTGRPKLVAVPTPKRGVRRAWMVQLIAGGAEPRGVASFVDAETGGVIVRDNLVDHLAGNPRWKVFPANPPLDYGSTDTRVTWCWLASTGCAQVVGNPASPNPWDVDPATGASTFTTQGNNSFAVHNWNSNNPFTVGTDRASERPDREYAYPWTNQWFTSRCNPTAFMSAAHNDIDAARANLFSVHNRMHDWAYNLGFTEAAWNMQASNFGRPGLGNDLEQGNAQAGGVSGGPPGFGARDNANQITPRDGLPPTTNMYLWQPIAGSFYAPCVDGDYDTSVIGHEFTHAISNRMAGGPNNGLDGDQAGAMGESWSDLDAVEYLNENGYVPTAGENPFSVGAYVTGDHSAGIRNYGMNASPLNYSDFGYDFACNQGCTELTEVHSDSEIWSAVNYDVRQAFVARYGAGSAAANAACAAGQQPVTACPGSRRWIQLMFDAWLLMPTGQVTMLDARDAMIAADQLRFRGVDTDIMWNAFAHRGFGQAATTTGIDDADPVASYDSPFADEATVRFRPTGDAAGQPAQLFVGQYEARVTPIADTDPGTALGDTFKLAPGTYELVARGNGFGAVRTTLTVKAGQLRDLAVNMRENLASAANGATTTGDGVNRGALIDDTESTNWAALGSPVAGKQVTVRLDPSSRALTFRRIQVSALLRTPVPSNTGDPAGQNRFSALRSFELLACEVRGSVDCSQDSQFTSVFTSPPDAFPSGVPRPRAPELLMRSFAVPQTRASFVRLRVLTNQCTGQAAYQGDQDDDPLNTTDCRDGSDQDLNVRAAELQVFAK